MKTHIHIVCIDIHICILYTILYAARNTNVTNCFMYYITLDINIKCISGGFIYLYLFHVFAKLFNITLNIV